MTTPGRRLPRPKALASQDVATKFVGAFDLFNGCDALDGATEPSPIWSQTNNQP